MSENLPNEKMIEAGAKAQYGPGWEKASFEEKEKYREKAKAVWKAWSRSAMSEGGPQKAGAEALYGDGWEKVSNEVVKKVYRKRAKVVWEAMLHAAAGLP
jgi:hypothetical protein